MEDTNNNKMIVKSNRLIEASYRLTTQEQRVILIMASMVRKDDEDFNGYQIKISDFAELVGIKGQSIYDELKKITKKLLSRVIVIHEASGDLQIGWLSSAKYYKKKGAVELHFDPKLKPYLLRIQEFFTKYKLKEVIRLKSSYSIRIYELLKQYETIGLRSFSIEEFRRTLGIEGSKYTLYGHLKNKVILPAQKELDEQCDLSFDFRETKKARKVIKIDFIIKPSKKEKQCALEETETKEKEPIDGELAQLKKKLADHFCLSEKQIDQITKKFNLPRIQKNLEYVEAKYKAGGINNIGPYTLKAIEENYYIKKSQFEIDEENKELARKKEEKERYLEEENHKRYKIYRAKVIEDHINKMPPGEFQSIENTIRLNIEREKKLKIGLKTFIRMAVQNHIAELSGVKNYEEWKKEQLGEND